MRTPGKRRRSPARSQQPRITAAELAAEAKRRAFDALHQMRTKGYSLRRASREALTSPSTVQKYVSPALRRSAGGRYRPTKSDRLTRRMQHITPRAVIDVSVRGSRDASVLARHKAAVVRFLKTGDTTALHEFAGKTVRVGNKRLTLVTDEETLQRLGDAGELNRDDIYRPVS